MVNECRVSPTPEHEPVRATVSAIAFRAEHPSVSENPYARRASLAIQIEEEEEEEEEEEVVLEEADIPAEARNDAVEGGSTDDAGPVLRPHEGGVLWHVQIVADDHDDPKHREPDGTLKARRPVPQILAADFFSHLEERDDGAFMYVGGPLNGWPGLVDLELRAITCKVRKTLRTVVKRFWDASWTGKRAPTYPSIKKLRSVRCTMRAPAWSARGWAPNEPGYAFWVRRRSGEAPEVFAGRSMLAAVDPAVLAVRCHYFAHRYAKPKAKETAKDLLTYHGACLVEFSDGTATIFELAWLNGLGGYGARSNWYGDPAPLYEAMPAPLKAPWRSDMCEVRLADVAFADGPSLEAYLAEHSGREPGKRFLDPKLIRTDPVRLAHRSKRDLLEYALNYVGRDQSYHEEWRNCQTFAADLHGFLAGKKGIEPYSQVCRVLYKPRPWQFLYDPALY